MAIKVGCCGWPVARARYFATFDLVEIQDTFYNLPRPATVEKWRATAPAGFEFVLKSPQLITHEPSSPTYRRLRAPLPLAARERYGGFKATREIRAAWEQTRALALLLGARVVLFQCPASFTPTRPHISRLTRFFEEVERDDLRFVWEPRGDWPDPTVRTLCKRLSLIHGVDPFQRRPVWGAPAYFRLHGRGAYRYRYSDADLSELRAIARTVGSAYVLFNNVEMFDDAQRFLALLETA
ncbi:MAG TPA: DUF72 domain-containing protein [Methylomirabilota bacterium]|nr:DUF72 domain-containing protein [Methylomirabilota bacterium]